VAQSALDVGMQYAQDRKQFGKPLIASRASRASWR
jgi:(2S)-methylsuccinyl-CoA dehydrogenase